MKLWIEKHNFPLNVKYNLKKNISEYKEEEISKNL